MLLAFLIKTSSSSHSSYSLTLGATATYNNLKLFVMGNAKKDETNANGELSISITDGMLLTKLQDEVAVPLQIN